MPKTQLLLPILTSCEARVAARMVATSAKCSFRLVAGCLRLLRDGERVRDGRLRVG